jgi:hypothetical protein
MLLHGGPPYTVPPRMLGIACQRLAAWGARRPVLAAAAIYALLSAAFFSAGLLPRHTTSGADYLWSAVPWTQDRPAGVSLFGSNGELVDPVTVFEPFLQHTRASLPDLPLWNTHVQAGRPFLANMQSAVFSPFALPAYVLPFWWSLSVIAFLKVLAAALGGFVAGRALGMRFGGALMCGLVYGFGLFFVVWIPWPLTSVWAVLPWLLAAVEWAVRRPGPLPAAALAGLTAVQFFGGHPESSFHTLFAAACFFVLRLAVVRPPLRGPLLTFGGGLALGGAAAAVTLVPFLELVAHSDDASHRNEAPPKHLPPRLVAGVFLSDWWGRPTQTPLPKGGFMVEKAMYAGALPLLLAAAALLRPRAERVALALFGAAVLTVVLGLPPLFDAVTALPLFGTAYNTRLTIVFLIAVALLAGWGLDELTGPRWGGRRGALLAIAGGALVAGPVVGALGAQSGLLSHLGEGLKVAWGFAHPPGPGSPDAVPVVRSAAVAVWVPFAAVAAALVVLRLRGRLAGGTFAAVAVVLTAADLFRAGVGQTPAIPTAHARQPATGAIRYLQGRRPARFVGVLPRQGPAPVPPDVAIRYGLYDARSYDYPVERRYDRLWRGRVAPLDLVHPPITVLRTDPPALRVLGLFGVADVVQARTDPPLRSPGLRLAYDGADARVYANERALPRVMVAGSQLVVPGGKAARAALAGARFDGRATVITEQRLPDLPSAGLPDAAEPAGSGRLVRYGPERVVIRVDARRPAEVVLSDVFYPGWEARVDGRPARLDRVDYLFRGVPVAAGRHTVEMRYRPDSFRAGWILSLVALAAVAALAVVGVRRGER